MSLKTVSRVINGNERVAPEIVSRVQEAIKSIDYVPNMAAVSLRRADRRTLTIGLILEDVANPFASALHRAVTDVAIRFGTLVFTGSTDEDAEREREILEAFMSHRVDGLILVPASPEGSRPPRPQARLGTPIVYVDRPGPWPDADSVITDNRGGARTAVGHLASHGHQRIAFLGDTRSIWTARERHAGYVEGLVAEGLDYDPALVSQDFPTIEAAEGAALDLLASPNPPTALFSGQNQITLGAIRALRQYGQQHRVALIGFDDIDLADMLEPAVSVVAQDPRGLGRTAAHLLFDRLADAVREPRRVVVPTRLIARGSGEIEPS